MRFSVFAAALLPFLADLAAAAILRPVFAATTPQTFTVQVGGDDSLTYNPSVVNASVGDTIDFQFLTKNHTVTQSTFADPCQLMTTPTTGIDSGFMPVDANATSVPSWSFTVTNASAPLWFFCRQTGHCQKGMVFAVNPTAAKTFAAFQAAANASTPATNGSSSASPSGVTTGSGGTTGGSSNSTPSPTASPTNGALSLGGSAAGLLTAVGLIAGLIL